MSRPRFFRSGRKHQGDPVGKINRLHTMLKQTEIEVTIRPLRDCFGLMCAGSATNDHYVVVYSFFAIANEIEAQGVVRGLQAHIELAMAACDSFYARCLVNGVWTSHELQPSELDAMRTLIDLHEFQLKQLTAREVHLAAQRVISRTLSTGGQVYHADIDLANLTPLKKQGVPA